MRSKLPLQKQMPAVLRTKVEKSAPEPTQYTYLHESSHAAQRLVPAHVRPPDCHSSAKKQLESNEDGGIKTKHTKNTQASNLTLTDLFFTTPQDPARQREFAHDSGLFV